MKNIYIDDVENNILDLFIKRYSKKFHIERNDVINDVIKKPYFSTAQAMFYDYLFNQNFFKNFYDFKIKSSIKKEDIYNFHEIEIFLVNEKDEFIFNSDMKYLYEYDLYSDDEVEYDDVGEFYSINHFKPEKEVIEIFNMLKESAKEIEKISKI